MLIEIWSDIMCPFCYIGKRKFESALATFSHSDDIEVVWKSFQLAPDLQTDTSISNAEYLAKHKGISVDEAKGMVDYVSTAASNIGLKYDFDHVVVANSFKAHRFSHLALKHKVQNQAEELLFRAYFTDGKNIDDDQVLMQIGQGLGINVSEIQQVLESDAYANDVNLDIFEASQLGIRGVPFFVFDRKYAVSGAQESQVFLDTLQKVYSEMEAKASE